MPKQITVNIGINRTIYNPHKRRKLTEHRNLTHVTFPGICRRDYVKLGTDSATLYLRVMRYIRRGYPGWRLTGFAPAKRRKQHLLLMPDATPRPASLFVNPADLHMAAWSLRDVNLYHFKNNQATLKVAVIPLTKRNGLTLRLIQESIRFKRYRAAIQVANRALRARS